MDNLEVVHCVTLSRKKFQEVNHLDESHRSHYDERNQIQVLPRKDLKLPVAQYWRGTSSEIVARGYGNKNQNKCNYGIYPNQDAHPQVVPDQYFLDCLSKDTLRTPMKKPRQKSVTYSSNMTKNCESLFTRMKSCHPKSVNFEPDPSYSVRRIVRNSGLLQDDGNRPASQTRSHEKTLIQDVHEPFSPHYLQEFRGPEVHDGINLMSSPDGHSALDGSPEGSSVGQDLSKYSSPSNTGKRPINELDDDPIPLYAMYNSCNREIDKTFNAPSPCSPLLSPPTSPLSLRDLDESKVNNAQDGTGSQASWLTENGPSSINQPLYYQQISHQPQLFDTIVYKKTVETEVVEYDYSEAETLADTTVTSSTAPFMKTPSKSKRGRSRAKKINRQRSKRMKHREAQSGYDPSSESNDSN